MLKVSAREGEAGHGAGRVNRASVGAPSPRLLPNHVLSAGGANWVGINGWANPGLIMHEVGHCLGCEPFLLCVHLCLSMRKGVLGHRFQMPSLFGCQTGSSDGSVSVAMGAVYGSRGSCPAPRATDALHMRVQPTDGTTPTKRPFTRSSTIFNSRTTLVRASLQLQSAGLHDGMLLQQQLS